MTVKEIEKAIQAVFKGATPAELIKKGYDDIKAGRVKKVKLDKERLRRIAENKSVSIILCKWHFRITSPVSVPQTLS